MRGSSTGSPGDRYGLRAGLLEKLLEHPQPDRADRTRSSISAAASSKRLGIPFELTRRGAIRADIKGRQHSPDRAIVAHLDTLGAQVKGLKPNGRLELVAIGTWSARFAEGRALHDLHRPRLVSRHASCR